VQRKFADDRPSRFPHIHRAKFPIEQDPRNPGDTTTHLVHTGPEIPDSIPSGLPIRESADFSSAIDQIEGDVDPVTLSTFTEEGTPNTTVNGDGTVTIITPDDAYPAWQLGGGNHLDSAIGWTWETRFRIDSANTANKGVWEIFLRDNDNGALAATRIHFPDPVRKGHVHEKCLLSRSGGLQAAGGKGGLFFRAVFPGNFRAPPVRSTALSALWNRSAAKMVGHFGIGNPADKAPLLIGSRA
jgi:hypothetical protein